MKEKILSWILGFFGLLGFAMIFGSAVACWVVGDIISIARSMIGTGFLFLVVVLIIDYLWRRRKKSILDKNWEKIKQWH